jgi:hypothetical protein
MELNDDFPDAPVVARTSGAPDSACFLYRWYTLESIVVNSGSAALETSPFFSAQFLKRAKVCCVVLSNRELPAPHFVPHNMHVPLARAPLCAQNNSAPASLFSPADATAPKTSAGGGDTRTPAAGALVDACGLVDPTAIDPGADIVEAAFAENNSLSAFTHVQLGAVVVTAPADPTPSHNKYAPKDEPKAGRAAISFRIFGFGQCEKNLAVRNSTIENKEADTNASKTSQMQTQTK